MADTAEQPSIGRIVGGVIGWTLAGAFAAPFVALAIILPIYALNDVCGTPGDSGGCEMGFGVMVIVSPLFGAGIGFVVGVVRAVRRARRAAA